MRLALVALLAWSFALRAWFGSFGLDPNRFWDERYSFDNVAAVLQSGPLHPANGWYPALSYLPQTALLALTEGLHRATGIEALSIWRGGGFSPAAYLVCRTSQALVGTLTLLLVFLIGRRLFSPGAGLLAAFLVAVTPAHIRLSAYFKPDILLLLLTLLTFRWSLEVTRRPRLAAYLRTGLGVGLATAAKLNGAAAALPLVVAAAADAASRDRRRRALGDLAAASLAAVATFLALAPFPRLYLEYTRRNARLYAERADLAGTGPLASLRQELALLVSPGFHGPVVGTAALLGIALLAASVVRHRRSAPAASLERAMLLVYGIGYSLLYALAAGYPKANNFLQVLPVTALAATWLAMAAWRRLERFRPAFHHRAIRGAALAIPVALLLPAAQLYAYRTALPSTTTQARRLILDRLGALAGRTVVAEGADPSPLQAARKEAAGVLRVAALGDLPPAELDLTDAELFPKRRLQGSRSQSYGRRVVAVPPGQVRSFEPRLLAVWGDALVVVLHPWERLEAIDIPLVTERDPGRFSGSLPPRQGGSEAWSFELLLPPDAEPAGPVALEVGGRPLELVSQELSWGGYRYGDLFTSRRRAAAGRAERVSLTLPPPRGDASPPRLSAFLWRPATAPPQVDSPADAAGE